MILTTLIVISFSLSKGIAFLHLQKFTIRLCTILERMHLLLDPRMHQYQYHGDTVSYDRYRDVKNVIEMDFHHSSCHRVWQCGSVAGWQYESWQCGFSSSSAASASASASASLLVPDDNISSCLVITNK